MDSTATKQKKKKASNSGTMAKKSENIQPPPEKQQILVADASEAKHKKKKTKSKSKPEVEKQVTVACDSPKDEKNEEAASEQPFNLSEQYIFKRTSRSDDRLFLEFDIVALITKLFQREFKNLVSITFANRMTLTWVLGFFKTQDDADVAINKFKVLIHGVTFICRKGVKTPCTVLFVGRAFRVLDNILKESFKTASISLAAGRYLTGVVAICPFGTKHDFVARGPVKALDFDSIMITPCIVMHKTERTKIEQAKKEEKKVDTTDDGNENNEDNDENNESSEEENQESKKESGLTKAKKRPKKNDDNKRDEPKDDDRFKFDHRFT